MKDKKGYNKSNNYKSKNNSKSNNSNHDTREEIRGLMKNMFEYTANTLSGKNKKKFKEDRLSQLGAPPVKQQKMPFRMKMGLISARKKIEQRNIEYNKIANITTSATKK